jgi:hypothetical protein
MPSGCAASRRHADVLYTHNSVLDRSSSLRLKPTIFAISATDAHLLATLTIGSGIDQYDWEDIVVGPCARDSLESCIFIGDIGQSYRRADFIIYRVLEPEVIIDQTLSVDSKLSFRYSALDTKPNV